MNGARQVPAHTPATPGPAYFNLLTAVRGGAALAVVIFHLTNSIRADEGTQNAVFRWFAPFTKMGWFGVDIFFLISGYGLAAKLVHDQGLSGGAGVLAFARNRFWRIFPVYWACCLLAVGLALATTRFTHADWRAVFPDTTRDVLASLLLVEPFTGTIPLLPYVTWTLTCELVFYLVIMIGIIFRRPLNNPLLLGAAVALALLGMAGPLPVLGLVMSFWAQFACGLLVFCVVHSRAGQGPPARWAALAALAGLGLVAWLLHQPRITATVGVGLMFIAAWSVDERLCALRLVRGLAWCGQISYPLFLLHIPIGTRLMHLGGRWIQTDSVLFLLVLALALAGALAGALAVHRWVELPAHSLARRASLSVR